MKICYTIGELDAEMETPRLARRQVGLVPTMGALHEGHLSLIRLARAANDVVVASIFVNPTQFGPGEDLAAYPRTLDRDLELLEAEGVAVAFVPSVEEIYPSGFATTVQPGPLGDMLEGASRPGHFAGVATVVLKLLHLVRPDRAYFGQKDAQQIAVIRAMTRDLNVPVEIVASPTVREADGLACSSRNARLQGAERAAATILYRALLAARNGFASGERDSARLQMVMCTMVAAEPLAQLDYASVVDPATFRPLDVVSGDALLVIAARIGRVRLIDNLALPG